MSWYKLSERLAWLVFLLGLLPLAGYLLERWFGLRLDL